MPNETPDRKGKGTLPDPVSYRDVLDNLFDGIYFVDRERKITFWNKAAERITGFTAEEVFGRSCSDGILNHVDGEGNGLCLGLCPLAQSLADGQVREANVFLHHKDGHRVSVAVRVSPVRSPGGRVVGAVEVFAENSHRLAEVREKDELRRLALLDPLTEVGNRRFLEMALSGAIEEVRRHDRPVGLLFADIDHFKAVNDAFGHEAGDRALRAVARTFSECVRSHDVVGRWGGEEFLVILKDISGKDLVGLAEKLRVLARRIFFGDEDEVSLSLSFGATLLKPDDSPQSAVERADGLMYRSKSAGRDRVTLG